MSGPYCPHCGERVNDQSRYCSRCGWKLAPWGQVNQGYGPPGSNYQEANYPPPHYRSWVSEKDPNLVLLLALLLGIFGIMGVGHLYIGKIARGIMFLILGLIIVPLFAAAIYFLIVEGVMTGPFDVLMVFVLLIVVWLIVLIVQTIDAYGQARTYNEVLRATGTPPW